MSAGTGNNANNTWWGLPGESNKHLELVGNGGTIFGNLTGSGTVPATLDSNGLLGRGTTATVPAIVTATVGLSNGYSQTEACTVNAAPETCIEQDFDTGAAHRHHITVVYYVDSANGAGTDLHACIARITY